MSVFLPVKSHLYCMRSADVLARHVNSSAVISWKKIPANVFQDFYQVESMNLGPI